MKRFRPSRSNAKTSTDPTAISPKLSQTSPLNSYCHAHS